MILLLIHTPDISAKNMENRDSSGDFRVFTFFYFLGFDPSGVR